MPWGGGARISSTFFEANQRATPAPRWPENGVPGYLDGAAERRKNFNRK
jgi:hypothetical protein